MKRTLLFFCFFAFFVFAYVGRYQPISLDLVSPSTKTVEIKGEVKKPGVYTIKWDGTIKDLIQAAGGLSPEADTSSIAMLKEMNPKEVIVIPRKSATTLKKVSLNTATEQELQTLPGIGPAMASRIIEYRKTKSFTSLEEIKEVKGIGDKMYEKIKDRICL